VKQWGESIRARELAEKRRVAPGWLDNETRMLMPERKDGKNEAGRDVDLVTGPPPSVVEAKEERNREGEELDRAFGGMGLK